MTGTVVRNSFANRPFARSDGDASPRSFPASFCCSQKSSHLYRLQMPSFACCVNLPFLGLIRRKSRSRKNSFTASGSGSPVASRKPPISSRRKWVTPAASFHACMETIQRSDFFLSTSHPFSMPLHWDATPSGEGVRLSPGRARGGKLYTPSCLCTDHCVHAFIYPAQFFICVNKRKTHVTKGLVAFVIISGLKQGKRGAQLRPQRKNIKAERWFI